jgi:outer membrane protein OmpA-like peptidoglycan-associated protein
VDASILLQGTGERVGNEASPAQLNMKVFFAEGQSSLSVEALAILDELIKYLNQQEAIRQVRIEGHSDSWGEAKNAQRLSDVRAKTVGDYLVKFGINPDRLVIKGYGFNLPLQLGSSETVRGTNRRVEFHILNYRE